MNFRRQELEPIKPAHEISRRAMLLLSLSGTTGIGALAITSPAGQQAGSVLHRGFRRALGLLSANPAPIPVGELTPTPKPQPPQETPVTSEISPLIKKLLQSPGMETWRNSLDPNVKVWIGDHKTLEVNTNDGSVYFIPVTATGKVAVSSLKSRLFPSADQPEHRGLTLTADESITTNLEVIILRSQGDSFIKERWLWIHEISGNENKNAILQAQTLFAAIRIQRLDSTQKIMMDLKNEKAVLDDVYIQGIPEPTKLYEWTL